MNRRSLLSAIGISALGGVGAAGPKAWGKTPATPGGVVALESFCVTREAGMAALHAYVAENLSPVVKAMHAGGQFYLEAIAAPHTPQLLSVTLFRSLDEMLALNAALARNLTLQKARAALESGPEPIVDRVDSQVLILDTGDCFASTMQATPGSVFELRSYHAASRDQLTAMHNSLVQPEAGVFQRAGVRPILKASSLNGQHLPRLTYLVPFADMATRENSWNAIAADPDWNRFQNASAADSGRGPGVVSISVYKSVPYSPAPATA